jgi:flagellar biosynthesis/type III secretory pathway ATPase
MMARNTTADVVVLGLIGERGREVRGFLENDLGAAGLERSVVVVSTSDHPPLARLRAAYSATAIAESFRDQGLHVLLMMDSVTRFAMAQREVGLAAGEPPTAKDIRPRCCCRAARARRQSAEPGSITAIYSVLVEGDAFNEPIADAVRGILDSHIVLRTWRGAITIRPSACCWHQPNDARCDRRRAPAKAGRVAVDGGRCATAKISSASAPTRQQPADRRGDRAA